MHEATYTFWVKSQAWSPENGIEHLDFAIEGLGNNVQLRLGTGKRAPVDRNDQPPAMWISTGEWVSFRGKLSEAPGVAETIVRRVEQELSEIAHTARERGWAAVEQVRFHVNAPSLDY